MSNRWMRFVLVAVSIYGVINYHRVAQRLDRHNQSRLVADDLPPLITAVSSPRDATPNKTAESRNHAVVNASKTPILLQTAAIQNTSHTPSSVQADNSPNATELKMDHAVEQPNKQQAQSPPTSVGFIHVGKTGGSSLTRQLRNGCHSFLPKPCRTVQNETLISRLIESYYHIPDIALIADSKHDSYLVTTRNPFERTVSSFLYEHPMNVRARGDKEDNRTPLMILAHRSCFLTLERFTEQIGDDPLNFEYPYPPNKVATNDCPTLAKAVLHGRIRGWRHLFFNFRSVVEKLPPSTRLYVTRQEHLWDDWREINRLVGQTEPIYIPTGDDARARDVTKKRQPITRKLSEPGRNRLCKALQPEFDAYFQLILRAVNLTPANVRECVEDVKSTCPNVSIPPWVSTTA